MLLSRSINIDKRQTYFMGITSLYFILFSDKPEDRKVNDKENEGQNEDMELAVFEFGTIAQATDIFSFNNKLGEGGFGPVYKVKLSVY